MNKKIMLKILILIVCITIIIILTMMFSLKKKVDRNNSYSEIVSNKNTDEVTNKEDDIDISNVWYHLDDLSYFKSVLSFETYIQKYIEKNKLINNFAGFNINDVWCYRNIQNEQNIGEYYIDGYVYNSYFSEVKEIAVKFSLNESNAFKIEKVDLTNLTWNDFLNNKSQEIRNNWENIKKQFEDEEANGATEEESEEGDEEDYEDENVISDEETVGEEDFNIDEEEVKPQYNENEFVVLDISDKELINRYFINFKIKTLLNKQVAYSLLHQDTKSTLFKNSQEFESSIHEYLNNNTTIKKIKVVNSIIDETGTTSKLVQYIIATENGSMFGLEITGIKDYTVAITKE